MAVNISYPYEICRFSGSYVHPAYGQIFDRNEREFTKGYDPLSLEFEIISGTLYNCKLL